VIKEYRMRIPKKCGLNKMISVIFLPVLAKLETCQAGYYTVFKT
jgi:hypothetical protein